MLTQTEIKLKDGSVLPSGTQIQWSKGQAFADQKKISALAAVRALGIEEPSEEQLDFWVFDSICESVLGNQVEPDGYDPEGSPSWLLVFGLV